MITLAEYYASLPRCPDCGRIMEEFWAFCIHCGDDPFGPDPEDEQASHQL